MKPTKNMEQWKPINHKFEISSCGNVRNINTKQFIKYQLRDGYPRIRLSKTDDIKTIVIHREVAKAFILNPLNKPQVNHIDGNKLNNNIENLEWVTNKENIRHAHKSGLTKPSIGKNKPRLILNLETGIYYNSLIQAAKTVTHLSYPGIQHQMNGRVKITTNLKYV